MGMSKGGCNKIVKGIISSRTLENQTQRRFRQPMKVTMFFNEFEKVAKLGTYVEKSDLVCWKKMRTMDTAIGRLYSTIEE